MILQVDKDLTQ